MAMIMTTRISSVLYTMLVTLARMRLRFHMPVHGFPKMIPASLLGLEDGATTQPIIPATMTTRSR
jgi:hypothetical protein